MYLLNIPFEAKDEAKKYGCKYDITNKLWTSHYDGQDADILAFLEKYSIVYLNVPYDEKDDVKANGARWDGNKKSWFTYKSNENLKSYM